MTGGLRLGLQAHNFKFACRHSPYALGINFSALNPVKTPMCIHKYIVKIILTIKCQHLY